MALKKALCGYGDLPILNLKVFVYFRFAMMRGILLVYISLSLFLSQANLPLFTHICHGMGKTWTTLIKPTKACCGKRKKDLREHHLASVQPKSCDTVDKSPCCEDHIQYASLSVELIKQVLKNFSRDGGISNAVYSLHGGICSSNSLLHSGIVHVHGPPVKLSGRDLLIAHQLFLC